MENRLITPEHLLISAHWLARDPGLTYAAVIRSGCHNYLGARIPLRSELNIPAWRSLFAGYHDPLLLDCLEFGWPTNFQAGAPLRSTFENHGSGVAYLDHVDSYVRTELKHDALLGPFQVPPVFPLHLNPLMTRPKKTPPGQSPARRVIMDMSWPHGESVNDGIPSDYYLSGPFEVHLPSVDFMANRLRTLGPGALMYKTDLARGYRQLRVDPADWPLLGFQVDGTFYMDVCPPFGMRSSCLMMQRTSEAVCYLHNLQGYMTEPYIDDFGGAEPPASAAKALSTLQELFAILGLAEAENKVCLPSPIMIWLGLLFDSTTMTVSIPQEKMEDVLEAVRHWLSQEEATRRQVQSLLGLLHFVAGVARPARLFTNRILDFLRTMPARGRVPLTAEFRRDLVFFRDLWPGFNGISVLVKHDLAKDKSVELDACLTGCGAIFGEQYYSMPFPSFVLQERHIIPHLEALNIVVACKMWAPYWRSQKVHIYCDNEAVCHVLTSGKARDPYLLACAREIVGQAVRHDFEWLVSHRPGSALPLADALSRAPASPRFAALLAAEGFYDTHTQVTPDERYFKLISFL